MLSSLPSQHNCPVRLSNTHRQYRVLDDAASLSSDSPSLELACFAQQTDVIVRRARHLSASEMSSWLRCNDFGDVVTPSNLRKNVITNTGFAVAAVFLWRYSSSKLNCHGSCMVDQ